MTYERITPGDVVYVPPLHDLTGQPLTPEDIELIEVIDFPDKTESGALVLGNPWGTAAVVEGTPDELQDWAIRVFNTIPPRAPLFRQTIDVAALRDEFDDNPTMPEEEIDQLKALSDTQLSDALEQCWPAVEDAWFAVLDDLRERAIRLLLQPMQEEPT